MPTTFPIPETPKWAIAILGVIVGSAVVLIALRKLFVPAAQALGTPIQDFIVWVLGLKKLIKDVEKKADDNQTAIAEMKGDVKSTSKATVALIEVNKANLSTPDIDPSIEAAVKVSASDTIDEDPKDK